MAKHSIKELLFRPVQKRYKLCLIDAATGEPIQGPVPWPVFCKALLQLCDEMGNITLEFDTLEDESVALFWQPPMDSI